MLERTVVCSSLCKSKKSRREIPVAELAHMPAGRAHAAEPTDMPSDDRISNSSWSRSAMVVVS